MKSLGIVGLGQFGRFAAKHLRADFDVVAYDPEPLDRVAAELKIASVSLAEAAAAEIVLFCVPVRRLADALRAAAPHLRDGALVIDVCSVKVWPLARMRELLPANVEIVGTHPMFGPQSAPGSLAGHRVVVCPERCARIDRLIAALESVGLDVLVRDADTHDRETAYTQALAQYLGRALRGIAGRDFAIRTPAAEMLREVERIVTHDSWELFDAIETLNPYAARMRGEVRARLDDIEVRLGHTGGPRPPDDEP